jgi:hypothetical protein
MTATTVAPRTEDGTGLPGLLRSELLKLTTTRMVILLTIIAAATGVLGAGIYGAIGVLARSEGGANLFRTTDFVATVYTGANQMARIVAVIAGAMVMGTEYRHKTLGTSYLTVPRRLDLVLGKATITFGYGLFLGLVATVLSFLTAVVFILLGDGSLMLGTATGWQALLMNIVTIGLWAMIGFGLGILIRNMIASVLIAVGFTYIVEPLLTLIFSLKHWTVANNLMPSGATQAALGVSGMSGLEPGAGASAWPAPAGILVLIGWAVLPAAIGCLATIRRDVE